MHDLLTRQLGRQRPTHRLGGRLNDWGRHGRWSRGLARLQIFERKLELGDLRVELLGGASVLLALQPRQLEAQLLDDELHLEELGPSRDERTLLLADEALEALDIIRQRARFGHAA
jgi:hypothetical protein